MASLVSQPRVAIAQLNPNLESADHLTVHGIVTLVWPYNSITQSLGLLLVDPDFRLRRHQGQVRIQLLGSSAKAVSKAGVSSGDELVLSLQGASWEKDNESANTPGRSIAWKLVFGERVVLETRREGESLKSVEIDHPPLSPELSRQPLSPPSSPIYNSHIPTSSRKQNGGGLNDNISTWSSPAFLKRNHFASSSYDPFTELDDDLADNNRKKKTKFGRGSGQWRFVGNEPSPEREHDTLPDRESSLSPSKSIRQVVENKRLPAPAPAATAAIESDEIRAVVEGNESSSHGNREVMFTLPEKEADREGLAVVESSSFRDRSPPGHIEERAVFESHVGRTQEGSPKTSDDQKTIDSPSARPLSSQTSPSVVSVMDNSSTSNLESSQINDPARDREGDAIMGESESGYGMDGSALSKAQKAVNITPMANEIGRRWVEMQSRANRAKAENPASRSGSMSSTQLRNESLVENLSGSRESSEKSEVSAPPRSGPIVPAMKQSLEDSKMSQDPNSLAKDDSEVVSSELLARGPPDESPLEQNQQHGDAPWAEKGPEGHSSISWSFDDRPQLVNSSFSSKDSPAVTNNNLSEDGQFLPAPSAQSASRGRGLTQMSPVPSVVDVDMGDDERQAQRENSPDFAKDLDEHQITNLNASQGNNFVHDVDDSENENSLVQKESVLEKHDYLVYDRQNDSMDVAGPSQAKMGFAKEESGPLSLNGPEIRADDLPDKPDSAKTVQESISDLQSEIHTVKSNTLSDPQDPSTQGGHSVSETGVPSTIPDTFGNHSANELVARDNARQMEQISQRPTSPIYYIIDDEDQPTRSPVRKINDSIATKDPVMFDRVDEISDQSESYDVSLPKQPTPQDDAAEETAITSGPVMVEEEPKVDSEAPNHDRTPGQKPLAQLSEELSEPKKAKEGKNSSSGSSLITRLKELRRRSDATGLERQSSSSANPWFAPRTPSRATNSEVNTNAITTPSEQIKGTLTGQPTNDTPEKSDKSLAQAFVRSSPTQSQQPLSPTTLTQESQYFPNSQQTAGFRTSLSYFVPVTSLHCHYGTTVDILAVAIYSAPVSRAPSGPRDNTQSIYVTDPSSIASKTPSALTTAQIFRPYRAKKESLECFPSLQPGDAILLRDFKVQSFQKTVSLISTDSSAWAVFRKDADVSIPGPPVEYGPEERAFARALWDWWSSLELAQTAALTAAVPKSQTGGAKKASAKKGLGFDLSSSQNKNAKKKVESTDSNVPMSLREHSGILKTSPGAEVDENDSVKGEKSVPPRRTLRPRKAKGMASASPEKEAKPKVEEIHELRDGTRYVDREGVDVEEVEMVNGVHDLRDGTRYRDKPRK